MSCRTLLVIPFLAFVAQAQSVNLTGTVTSAVNGAPVAGATVALANRSLTTQTDANGYYELIENATGAALRRHGSATTGAALQLTASAMVLTLGEAVEQVRVELFDMAGRPLHTVEGRALRPGTYSFALSRPALSPQMHVVALTVNGVTRQSRCLRVPGAGMAGAVRIGADGALATTAQSTLAKAAAPAAAVDTIKVTRSGYMPAAVPVSTYTGAHDIALDSACFRLPVTVVEDSTFVEIPGANVVVYDAATGTALARAFSDQWGGCVFYLEPYSLCYVQVSALNYRTNPAARSLATILDLGAAGESGYYEVPLKKDRTASGCGGVTGYVRSTLGAPVVGALVVAIRQTDSITMSGYSGPDGMYALYNIPQGVYEMQAGMAGWYQTAAVTGIQIDSQQVTDSVDIQMTANAGSSLSGRITFLATHNSDVDVVLAHPVSFGAIPGLSTMSVSQNYSMSNIPPGTYVPWASFYNDGYVMDPDWIRKFGLPVLTVTLSSGPQTVNFSVTGAIVIVSPTNAPDTLVPREIYTDTPTFVWTAYPSTQEYVIAVYDNFGDIVWGGYDAAGNILHTSIPSSQTSAVYNFDGTASEPIRPGRQYRWKVWSDKGAQAGVQQLLSSSEDLMGLFARPGD